MRRKGNKMIYEVKVASRLELFLAKCFGKKRTGVDGATARLWRGRIYITEVKVTQ